MKKCKNLLLIAGLATFLAIGCGNHNEEKPATPGNEQQKPSDSQTGEDKDKGKDKDASSDGDSQSDAKSGTDANSDAASDQHDSQSDAKSDTDGKSDAASDEDQPKECLANHFGAECKPCTCKHGTCNDGKDGTGECSCDSDIWTGDNCDECKNSLMTGENCDECKNSLMTGENCDECKDVLKKGDNCDQPNYVDINGTKWAVKNQNTTAHPSYLIREPITCHYRNEETFKKYGCLYTWADAIDVCPRGWRLPKKEDFENLLKYLGGTESYLSNIEKIKSLKDTSWGGTNTTGFSALPAGYRTSDGRYINFGGMGEGDTAYFWSQDKYEYYNSGDTKSSHYMSLSGSALVSQTSRENAYSVRCIWVYNVDD